MDSLSQIVLGAAVGELILGNKLGNKAMLIGAIGGTIPDLDVFLNPLFTDEITKLQIHRGYSHSIFIHLLLAWPFAWISKKISKQDISMSKWYLTWYLLFFTHVLLDSFTTYGTQLFLPFTNYPVGFNNISVVDPFWTIPFLLLLIVTMFFKRTNPTRYKVAWIAMGYGIAYMGYTFVNKWNVHQHFASELERQHIQVDEISTSPSIFNNWLWSCVATTNDSLYVGEYSVFQDEQEVRFVGYARNLDILDQHPAKREVEVLKWFGQGKTFVVPDGENLDVFLVKWGRSDWRETEPKAAFIFYWKILKTEDGWKGQPIEPDFGKEEFSEAWNSLWWRVFHAQPL